MPFAESRRACESRACYRPHHHPTFSIGAVDGGQSVFTGAEAGPVSLFPGTLVFVPAARVHACNPFPGKAWSYQMLHLDADWLHAVRQEYAGAEPAAPEPVRVITAPSRKTAGRSVGRNALRLPDRCDKEAALIEFIGDFDTEQGLRLAAPGIPSHLAGQIRPALECLRAAPSSSVTLDELARLTAMSRYQMIRAFRAVTGMTPHAWQLNLRINLARARLRDGQAISAVAQHLGFADQAHFQRVFKAHVGVTPGRYR